MFSTGPANTSSGHLCSADGRSFTDILTNAVVFADLDFNSLAHVLQARISPALLPDLMHEFAHHWCLFSPVGHALATLRLRSRQRLFTGKTQGDFLPDVLRYEVAKELFRPISEGLALFAEFDLKPGPARYRTTLLHWVLTLFRADASSDFDSHLTHILNDVHRTEGLRRKKEDLLGRPLGCADGGYLPGYLGLKRLWNAHSEWWHDDSELFFGFVRSTFFEDYGIVASIMDPDVEVTDLIDHALPMMAERFEILNSRSICVAVDRFESSAADGSMKLPTPNDSLAVNRAAARRGGCLLDEAFEEITSSSPSIPDVVTLGNQWTLARRERLCLVSVEADIVVNEHHRVVVTRGELPLYGSPARPGVPPMKGTGFVELYFSASETFYVTLVILDHQCVGSMFFDGDDESKSDLRRDYISGVTTRSQQVAFVESEEANFETFLRKQPTYENVEAFRGLLSIERDELYVRNWALRGLSDVQLDLTRNAATEYGIYQVLDGDLPLLRSLVAAGLGGELLADRDRQRLLEVSTRTGVALLRKRSDGTYLAI